MTPSEIIAVKREGKKHSREHIALFVKGATTGDFDSGQVAAWLMAAYINGLDHEETAWLTQEMAQSGDRLDLSELPKPWVDKHSTGGVGDKTTIVVLPIIAACGLTIVKMSGAGLGITGGTVDKLGSIPGFRVDLTPKELIAQAKKIGIALSAQTQSLAPADGVIYKMRGVTATVDSIPLIVSSILSKKIAGGAETVVLDVKCGSGAFMPSLERARDLSVELVRVANLCGIKARCVVTDMDQPLGATAGNLIEVQEAIRTLRGDTQGRFLELCLNLSGLLLSETKRCESHEAGIEEARKTIGSGLALNKFEQWLSSQGVASRTLRSLLDDTHLESTITTINHKGPGGYVNCVHAGTVGHAVLDLGGGRHHKDAQINPRVGIETLVEVGDQIETGTPLFRIFANENTDKARSRLESAVTVSSGPVGSRHPILEII